MQIKELQAHWDATDKAMPVVQKLTVEIDAHTGARLDAIAELFPHLAREQLVCDLLHAAVDEFERSLPYVPGEAVVEHDEEGNPVYEDAGLTPRLQALVRRRIEALNDEAD